MKLAFCLFNYFPHGGLQKVFLQIANACCLRQHEVHIYTMDWQGPIPSNLEVHRIAIRGISNHAKCLDFTQKLPGLLEEKAFDKVIGFNRIPGIDIYYAADICYASDIERRYNKLMQQMPRYKTYKKLEENTLNNTKLQKVLFISAKQQQDFLHYYPQIVEKSILLPPYLDKAFANMPSNRSPIDFMQKFNIGGEEKVLLFIASRYKTKGLDRAIHALAALPEKLRQQTSLIIAGEDKQAPYKKLATDLKINHKVHFLGARDDIQKLLLHSSLLIHPARKEAAGNVLIEALACGVPVLTTAECGFAEHIIKAEAGHVLATPFQQTELNSTLHAMLDSKDTLVRWHNNALKYIANNDFFNLPEHIAKIIENN